MVKHLKAFLSELGDALCEQIDVLKTTPAQRHVIDFPPVSQRATDISGHSGNAVMEF